MVHQLAKLSIEKYNPDILINIPTDSASTFDFFKANELIELGENAATEALNNYYLKQKINA